MTTKPGDMQAFPHSPIIGAQPSNGSYANSSHAVPMYGYTPGLTKREEFARSAMIGILADANSLFGNMSRKEVMLNIVSTSVELADALIVELERTK